MPLIRTSLVMTTMWKSDLVERQAEETCDHFKSETCVGLGMPKCTVWRGDLKYDNS